MNFILNINTSLLDPRRNLTADLLFWGVKTAIRVTRNVDYRRLQNLTPGISPSGEHGTIMWRGLLILRNSEE